ncbi:MAG: YIP1 family protein [Ruminococcaceae bacterium]|nr:YIP1 family protein [Oscillospiraceae bacterium]
MANFSTQGQLSQHSILEQKYKNSRMNLLLVVVFTAINLFLLVINTDLYFLFSAFIPYFIVSFGMLVCGRFPEEYYTDDFGGMTFLDDSVFVVLLVISAVLTLLYFLAWLMSSKNRVGWLIFALVFFGIDTVGMLALSGITIESAFDILFHAWVIYYLILGISAHYKLKKLPPEEEEAVVDCENILPLVEEVGETEQNSEPAVAEPSNSNAIREADKDVKHRVLLEKRTLNYDICYRRVKHTNELIVNGNVYDEIEGVFEYPHTLKAWVDGHYISAGYTGTHSFISVDGENVAKKLRLV